MRWSCSIRCSRSSIDASRARIGLDAVEIALELERRLAHLALQRQQTPAPALQRRVDALERVEPARRFGEQIRGAGRVVAQGISGQESQRQRALLPQATRVGEPRVLRPKLRRLLRIELRLVDLAQLEREEVLPARTLLGLGAQPRELLVERLQRAEALGHGRAPLQEPPRAVEQPALHLRAQQRL